MITFTKHTVFGNKTSYKYDFIGLSTDEKPTENIANGSTFLEKTESGWAIYIFDEENETWNLFANWSVN